MRGREGWTRGTNVRERRGQCDGEEGPMRGRGGADERVGEKVQYTCTLAPLNIRTRPCSTERQNSPTHLLYVGIGVH